ncbi:MAG: DNA-3-methyladenine glycosylase I [Pseudomonadales bacterium]|nr:DNA-3-methyladenine glycosylase I [Pseudomonadales bacterium]MCP5183897.1 DNA-3-methyladenine glycosylase I [Pseudomonadales bacterium]
MESFATIHQRAADRKGGIAALDELLPVPSPDASLRRLKDSTVLAEMTRCVFRSGFVWQIIDNKWDGFDTAFHHFDVQRCLMLSDEELEALSADQRIVRNNAKIRAVPHNARFIAEIAAEHGSFGRFLAGWPNDDIVGLWDILRTRGNRLGGQTGRFFLRLIGRDTPILSPDVVTALIHQGVVDREPSGRKALLAVQAAFNTWQVESGRPLCQISRILACSVP